MKMSVWRFGAAAERRCGGVTAQDIQGVREVSESRNHAAPEVVVAREGSELATRLRSHGWTARGGWRATEQRDQFVWYVRYEAPAAPVCRFTTTRRCGARRAR
jgi:hypothetical protein